MFFIFSLSKKKKKSVHPPEILPEMKNFVYFKLKRNYMLEVSFTKKIFNETGYNLNCCNYNDDNDDTKSRDIFISLVNNIKAITYNKIMNNNVVNNKY